MYLLREIQKQILENMWLPCELVVGQDPSLVLNLVHYEAFSSPVIHPGNYHARQQKHASVAFSETKCQARWMFDVSQDGTYV